MLHVHHKDNGYLENMLLQSISEASTAACIETASWLDSSNPMLCKQGLSGLVIIFVADHVDELIRIFLYFFFWDASNYLMSIL